MISVNYSMFVQILFVLYVIVAILSIAAGIAGTKKSEKHGIGDVIMGIILLLILALCVVF